MAGHHPLATLEVQGLRRKLQQATSVVFAVFVVFVVAAAAALVFVVAFLFMLLRRWQLVWGRNLELQRCGRGKPRPTHGL